VRNPSTFSSKPWQFSARKVQQRNGCGGRRTLDHRKPIDLLSTPAGIEAVKTHLTLLEYGVYT